MMWYVLAASVLFTAPAGGVVAQTFDGPALRQADNLNAYSKKFGDVLAFANNPATLPVAQGWSAALRMERRFMLAALSHYHAVVGYYNKGSAGGIHLNHGGSDGYSESMLGLSYGKNLGSLRLGVQFNYHRLSIAGYGSGGTYSADLAVIWHLTDKLSAGIQALNPVPVFFGTDRSERFSSAYKLGLGHELSDAFFIGMEITKEEGKRMSMSVALQYQLLKKLFVRLAVNTDPGRPSAAAGWEWKGIRLYITGSYHPQLGTSPGMMLIFGKTKNNK